MVTVEDEEDLKCSQLKAWEKEYGPKQVLIEYNGMWQMERLYREVLPANWVLYQIMTFVKADTFEVYAKNMGQLMMEKVTNADLLVFNRATPELREALRKRNLRMVNRRADIYFENTDGTSEDYLTGDECPFDLSQDVVEIPDEDFGVWYVDVMDHPDRYSGRLVHMKLMMCHSIVPADSPWSAAKTTCSSWASSPKETDWTIWRTGIGSRSPPKWRWKSTRPIRARDL